MNKHESFELIAEGARENWLAARAANDIGSCIPTSKIPREELEALIAHCETELRERDRKEKEDLYMGMFDNLITNLTGEVF
jgi:hypothetical protein